MTDRHFRFVMLALGASTHAFLLRGRKTARRDWSGRSSGQPMEAKDGYATRQPSRNLVNRHFVDDAAQGGAPERRREAARAQKRGGSRVLDHLPGRHDRA
jgi:hypothetical protein